MPFISVIVPVYNCEATLGKTLASLQAQTLRDMEIILIDDASTDSSVALAQQFAAADARIKILQRKENGGISAARNDGLAAAQGTWIALVDADDWIAPERFEHMTAEAERLNADALADNLQIYDFAHDRVIDQTNYSAGSGKTFLSAARFFDHDGPMRRHSYGYMKPIIRKRFLDDKGIMFMTRFRSGEDFVIFSEILLSGGKLAMIPQAYYVYLHQVSPTTMKRATTSRSPEGHGFKIGGCDALFEKYSGSMTQDEKTALARRRQDFVTSDHAHAFVDFLKDKKPLAALAVLIRHPFTILMLANYVRKIIHANVLAWIA